jgi:3-hydroxyacyl-CoA dehydrogenase / 3-hydroxy-2-methylbutyryl-CoA dehydrogenase
MNGDDGAALVARLGPQTKFFECNVLDTNSVQAAVEGTVQWISSTGKPLGGVIPAAGVAIPATVRLSSLLIWSCLPLLVYARGYPKT